MCILSLPLVYLHYGLIFYCMIQRILDSFNPLTGWHSADELLFDSIFLYKFCVWSQYLFTAYFMVYRQNLFSYVHSSSMQHDGFCMLTFVNLFLQRLTGHFYLHSADEDHRDCQITYINLNVQCLTFRSSFSSVHNIILSGETKSKDVHQDPVWAPFTNEHSIHGNRQLLVKIIILWNAYIRISQPTILFSNSPLLCCSWF